MYVERHSADNRTCIRKMRNHNWEVWFEDELRGVFFTREDARERIQFLKKKRLPPRGRWDLIGDPEFLAHLPDTF